jgi:hypothetical protein
LIIKYLDQFIGDEDTVLILSRKKINVRKCKKVVVFPLMQNNNNQILSENYNGSSLEDEH